MNVEKLKGGAEYNILQFRDCGVYLCLRTVSGRVFGDFKVGKHAFIYNFGYRNKDHAWCIGSLIDNRTHKPVRLFE